ncbi:MAG: anhydro-N-acetylmuramic acid kinase [Clostridium sp.]|uniref:Anhydro-N-acetylmuramic acid kinase n=1 Tax=Clostridium paraputrificum TaxID=29363 RepID=A0A6N3BCT1_9CLOT|nr:anhydro-N-acetylmuramic acid kinase AnmK [Clostridium sp.]MBS5926613.1 anhydro-N-acetylmuramic acid kinase [Clostridium sp.]
MYAVGLMSGTSLDGVDSVLVDIEGSGISTKINVIGFNTYEIPQEIKKEIKQACSLDKSSSRLICSLNFKIGYLFSECVKNICSDCEFDINNLDFIASHGQTIYHIPEDDNDAVKSTLQIGESSVIAYETKTKVISNFRVMDMAAGGEGAPLVPFSEYILYSNKNEGVLLQNIGGIGNVTVIPRNSSIDDIYAFDTGPGNMIIDEVMFKLLGKRYDNNGNVAASGVVIDKMLLDLMSEPYIQLKPPKTTGREKFGEQYVRELLHKYGDLNKEDIIATVTMFTAKSIAENYRNFVLNRHKIDKIILGGGGAHNSTLVKFLKELLPELSVLTQEEVGYSSDAKEAIAFVVLGNETMHRSFSNVPSATGAKEKVILGTICESPFINE